MSRTVQIVEQELAAALQAYDSLGEVLYGTPAHRQQDAIFRKMESLDQELSLLESGYYNYLAEAI